VPSNDEVLKYLEFEKNRYKSKGFGIVVAAIIAFSYFYFGVVLAHHHWASFVEWMDSNHIKKWHFAVFGSQLIHIVVVAVVHGALWIVYHIEHPFFERYKVGPEPWPWH
jgi:tetrahydromethanopterin S-methyltransferase subunit D